MRSFLIVLSAGFLLLSFCAAGWDPGDATFDPSVKETIANGSTRIGDPSPVSQDGYDIVGYTYLVARGDGNSGVLVWVSFTIPFVPGEMEKPGGATMFLSVAQAETLQVLLTKAIEGAGAKDRKEVGVVFENPNSETWKVIVDGSTEASIVLHRKMAESTEQYRLSLNPAKKMLDALNHYIAEGKKLEAEKK